MKKKIVEVDEDVLKEIIVGDIPVFGKDSLAPKEKPVEHQEAKSPASTVPADTPAPVIAPEMSISGFISNILVDHLQKHWDEINELYNKEYYKPLKPF